MWNASIYLWHCRNSVKNCFPTQSFIEIGQMATELWPKTICNLAAVRHLEFSKFSYLVAWLPSSSKSAVVYQISSKSDDFFCSDMTFWRFSRWRITASFKRTRMGSLKSPCWTSCWSLIEINVKKLWFIHELTANDTSTTAKITKRWLPTSTSPKCQCAVE